MASTSFVDQQTTIVAAWLNDVNTVTYTGFGQWLANSPQPLNYSDTGILGALVTNTPGYNQLIVGNLNTGATASSSYLAGNNLTTPNTNYVEFGINGGGYTGAGAFNGPGYGYLATASTDLTIGTYGNNSIHFVVNSGATDAMTISGAGVVTAPTLSSTNATITNLTVTNASIAAPLESISASVASNALTVGFNAAPLQFRNATLTLGTPVGVSVGTLSLTVPSGATLGSTSTIQSQLVLLVLYNGGTPALGIVNMAGGVNLDETTLISTTAISGSANSASTVYSTAGITNSPFRVVGYINITEATAGTWATAPTLVQGYGGQAMAAMQSLGFGQTWQNVLGSRAAGTTYYNTTSRTLFVSVAGSSTSGFLNCYLVSTISGVATSINGNNSGTAAGNSSAAVSLVVPPGGSYSVAVGSGTLTYWAELR